MRGERRQGHAAAALIRNALSPCRKHCSYAFPPPGQEETEWLTIDDTGDTGAHPAARIAHLAAAVSRSGKVVALAPATQILLAEPVLPPGSGVKLARAVPFALEEQLTEDVDQLSFAIGRRRSGGSTPVAAVSRTVLQDWLSRLERRRARAAGACTRTSR